MNLWVEANDTRVAFYYALEGGRRCFYDDMSPAKAHEFAERISMAAAMAGKAECEMKTKRARDICNQIAQLRLELNDLKAEDKAVEAELFEASGGIATARPSLRTASPWCSW